jgi:hypothetical protein
MLHDDFVGWSDENPMPRDRSSTAVAHYYYAQSTEDSEGERETSYGRYTDVLVKTPNGWKFIAWRGGDDPRFNSDDD